MSQVDKDNHSLLKKRNRHTIVCTNCKRRKTQCDRQSPCSSCLKSKHHKGTCIYNDLPEAFASFGKSTKIRRITQTKDNNNSNRVTTAGTVLDLKLNGLKSFSMMRKRSKTQLSGPVSGFAVMMGSFSFQGSLFASIKKFLSAERRAWKSIHGSDPCLHRLVNAQCELNEVVSTIERVLVPNCNSVVERLVYFRDHLNDLLYNGFVDMSYVTECFKKLFTYSEGDFHFNQPTKNYTFSELALILAVVESASLFSEYETKRLFKFPLDLATINEISRLAPQCLALSNFQRKRNFSALIALIILKDSRYVYSSRDADSMDKANSQIVIEMCILLAFQLGLHKDPASFCEFGPLDYSVYQPPPANSRTLWNYLKMAEAYNSIHTGIPLLISDMFTDSSCSLINDGDWLSTFSDLEREASILFNSIKVISINDVDELLDKFLSLNSSLGTFKDLISSSNYNLPPGAIIIFAQKLSVKFKLMRNIGMFYHFLQKNVANTNIYPKDQLTPENSELIKQRLRSYKIKFMKFSFISWGALRELSEPHTIFGDDSKKYLVYLKTDLLQMLYASLIGFAFSMFSCPKFYKSSSNINNNPDNIDYELIKLETIDHRDIEISLNSNTETNSISDERFLASFNSPQQAIEISTAVHSSISRIPLLTENYGYFCLMKVIAVFSCFSDSMIKLSPSLQHTDEQMKEVIELTRTKMESTMRLGYVDLGFSLENDENSIQNWLDSIFDENGLFKFFDPTSISTDDILGLGSEIV